MSIYTTTKNSKAFSLIEIIVTLMIVGVLGGLAIPSFRVTLEKTKAAEGIELLRTVSTANAIYKQEHGTNASAIEDLSIEYHSSDNFIEPIILNPATSGGRVASTRRRGLYTLLITENGTAIECDDSTTTWTGICASLGY